VSVPSRRPGKGQDEAADAADTAAQPDDEIKGILLTPVRVFSAVACLLLAFAALVVVASLPASLPSRLRPNTSLYIACNLYNNEDIMPRFNTEILRLVHLVGAENLYVSVFENGSTDDTKGQLQLLQEALQREGVQHTVHTSAATWRDYRTHVDGPHRVLRQRRAAAAPPNSTRDGGVSQRPLHGAAAATALRSAGPNSRIPIMARVRNEALKPLLSVPWLLTQVDTPPTHPSARMGAKWTPPEPSDRQTQSGDPLMRVINPLYEPLFAQTVGPPSTASPPLPIRTAQWVVESIASALSITPLKSLQQHLAAAHGTYGWTTGPGIGQGKSAAGNGPMTAREGNLGLPHPITIVFVNDVKLKAEHIIGLANTADGEFDVACALDFALLKLYDTWVIRDVAGRTLSGWWPFLREPDTQAMLAAGQPFPVSQCWNGMVALDAASWVGKGLLFRPWQHQERRGLQEQQQPSAATDLWEQQWWGHLQRLWNTVRVEWMPPPAAVVAAAAESGLKGGGDSVQGGGDGVSVTGISVATADEIAGGAAAGGVYGGSNCAASECGLFTKDLMEAGHPRVLVNPAVQLVYDRDSQLLQNLLMVWVNPLLLGWANRPHRHGPMVRGCVYPACRHIPGTQPLSTLPLQRHTAAWKVLTEADEVQVRPVHSWWVPPPHTSTCGLDGFEAQELAEAAERQELPPWRHFTALAPPGEEL